MISEISLVAIQSGEAASGASDTARYVETVQRQGRKSLRESATIESDLHRIRAELNEVIDECEKPDWDGYNAEPVKRGAVLNSFRFAEVIPLGLPVPSIAADPDGDVTFEWYKNPDWTLSVSVDENANLHYAALLGPGRAYGTEPFVGILPSRILDLIYQVTLR